MSARPGRNDPCHCGSGMKYKKCHLAEDEARERTGAAARAAEFGAPRWTPEGPTRPAPLPVLPSTPPPPELTPEEQAAEARWERFEAAGYEERVRLFEEAIATGDLDAEYAFSMLDLVHPDAAKRNERGRFRGLVELLRERRPDLYAEDLVWYHSWLIEDAVAAGEYERLPALVAPLADVAEKGIDEIFRLMDVLMFHDQVEPLLDMMTRAWPAISTSREILPGGVAEFATILSMLHIYHHLDRGGVPRADDPELQAALAPLGLFDEARIQQALDALSGAVARDWELDDFLHVHAHDDSDDDDGWDDDEDEPDGGDDLDAFDPFGDLDDDDDEDSEDDGDDEDEAGGQGDDVDKRLAEHLFVLLLEWAGTLRRERGVRFSRVEVMRETLIAYLMDRPTDKQGRLPLLPDRASAEQRLAALMSFLSGQYYKSGALFALLPSYIDFITARGLAKRDAARRARQDILALRPHMLRVVIEATDDPALHDAVAQAGLRAGSAERGARSGD